MVTTPSLGALTTTHTGVREAGSLTTPIYRLELYWFPQNSYLRARLLQPDQHDHRPEEEAEPQRAATHELIRREVERHDAPG